jgi:primosomal protein N' (replication factor Y)
LRWDRDTAKEKDSHITLLDRFSQHQADVLIGTQMIAKGLDLPRVTLVGVISADTALNLPDFRAAERTFQLLTQVAGRAGRGPSGGQVIIQTYAPEHYAIQSAAQHDYAGFYAQERAFRQKMGYPPFSRLARLVRSEPSLAHCRQAAQDLAMQLRERLGREQPGRERPGRQHLETVSLVGPAPCFLSRLRGNWRWQIIVRAPSSGTELDALLSGLQLAPGWRLDIDPQDML